MNLTLNDKLSVIGLRLNLRNAKKLNRKELISIDIEGTLIEAAREVPNDSKLFSLLCSWILVHGDYAIVEKLFKKTKLLDAKDPAKNWIMALAVFAKTQGFHNWGRWVKKLREPLYAFDRELTLSAIRRKGAIKDFERYGIFVPEGSLRVRRDDALTPKELAHDNQQYRNRLLYGASWRADIVTAIEQGAANPFVISKSLGCSYEPAHRIFREYQIANPTEDVA